MTALEVIEHLDPHILSRFGVVTMGTYRPRILLVTTPVSLSSYPPLRVFPLISGLPRPLNTTSIALDS